jgi:hypothetical protein
VTKETAVLSLLAQGLADLISNEDYFEMLLWGIGFVFVIIGLFILNRVLRIGIGGRVKSQTTPFAMTPEDLDRLREEGQLTEEEMKKIRASMSRQFLQRVQEEEERKKKPAKADIALEVETSLAEETTAGSPTTPAKRPPLERAPAPPPSPADKLPEHLRPMVDKSDLELEELRTAGFITPEEVQQVRRARE